MSLSLLLPLSWSTISGREKVWKAWDEWHINRGDVQRRDEHENARARVPKRSTGFSADPCVPLPPPLVVGEQPIHCGAAHGAHLRCQCRFLLSNRQDFVQMLRMAVCPKGEALTLSLPIFSFSNGKCSRTLFVYEPVVGKIGKGVGFAGPVLRPTSSLHMFHAKCKQMTPAPGNNATTIIVCLSQLSMRWNQSIFCRWVRSHFVCQGNALSFDALAKIG